MAHASWCFANCNGLQKLRATPMRTNAENDIRESPKNIDTITFHRGKNNELLIVDTVQCNEGL